MKKVFLLFLALLLPVLIFVFLKYAGKNEFNIPVFHEEGIANAPADCHREYPSPYRIIRSVWLPFENKEANVVVFPVSGVAFDKLRLQLDDEFGSGNVWLKDACTLARDSTECADWMKCIFLVNQPNQSILVDSLGRIRGYYDLRLRDEVDRLRVELKILMKMY